MHMLKTSSIILKAKLRKIQNTGTDFRDRRQLFASMALILACGLIGDFASAATTNHCKSVLRPTTTGQERLRQILSGFATRDLSLSLPDFSGKDRQVSLHVQVFENPGQAPRIFLQQLSSSHLPVDSNDSSALDEKPSNERTVVPLQVEIGGNGFPVYTIKPDSSESRLQDFQVEVLQGRQAVPITTALSSPINGPGFANPNFLKVNAGEAIMLFASTKNPIYLRPEVANDAIWRAHHRDNTESNAGLRNHVPKPAVLAQLKTILETFWHEIPRNSQKFLGHSPFNPSIWTVDENVINSMKAPLRQSERAQDMGAPRQEILLIKGTRGFGNRALNKLPRAMRRVFSQQAWQIKITFSEFGDQTFKVDSIEMQLRN